MENDEALALCSTVHDVLLGRRKDQSSAAPLIRADLPEIINSRSVFVAFYYPSGADLRPLLFSAATALGRKIEGRPRSSEAFSLPHGCDFAIQDYDSGYLIRIVGTFVKVPETKDELDAIGLPWNWTRVAPAFYDMETDQVLHNVRVADVIRIDVRVGA